MDKMFMVFKADELEYIIFDKKRNIIISLKNGRFEDITNKCQKIYNKELNKVNKKLGGLWYGYLIGAYNNTKAYIFKDDIVLETDNQKEFDNKILEIKKEQIELMLQRVNKELQKLINNKQYYTYAFSNC